MMEASVSENYSPIRARTMAELLPSLSGLLSKDQIRSLTSTKKSRPTMALTSTKKSRPTMAVTKSTVKPMTFAEMTAELQVLKTVKKTGQFTATSTKKKQNWNSSVKIENKKVSHTGNGDKKHDGVRKVLNFQPIPVNNCNRNPQVLPPRTTINGESQKFPKPEFRAKKTVAQQAKPSVRISGIYNIVQTPRETPKLTRPILNVANKENIPAKLNNPRKSLAPPKVYNHRRLVPPVPDTPLSYNTSMSSCDASFLQKEREIQNVNDKKNARLENIDEALVSTPFKEYRNVQDYFRNSTAMDNSAVCQDDTIMCFDNPSAKKENGNREESVIVSLCDLLNKAKVTVEKPSDELFDLLEFEKQTQQNIQMIENGIEALINIKKSQIKSLENVRKVINEKKNDGTKSEGEGTLKTETLTKDTPEKSPVNSKPCSVIKSPTYRIPKKNLCLRKKVIHKSMPNIANAQTPVRSGNKVLSMYMKMKEQMNFLNTPVHKPMKVPDTPAITSQNLQMQLDKLYNGSL